jgi:hypothetical protein
MFYVLLYRDSYCPYCFIFLQAWWLGHQMVVLVAREGYMVVISLKKKELLHDEWQGG